MVTTRGERRGDLVERSIGQVAVRVFDPSDAYITDAGGADFHCVRPPHVVEVTGDVDEEIPLLTIARKRWMCNNCPEIMTFVCGTWPIVQTIGSGVASACSPQRGHPFPGGVHHASPHDLQSNLTGITGADCTRPVGRCLRRLPGTVRV
jgi:hypothetical protein